VYSTCIFCQRSLGSNETFATFPVGTRLAYDAQKGRLWVVCPHCARWNLTPLEERWEAIEEAERRFHHTRLRAGTGEISLARLREGTELVRIGRPPGLELASWRYGDAFNRRRTQHLYMAGGVIAGAGLAMAGAVSIGLGIVSAWQLANAVYVGHEEGAPWRTIARLRRPDGRVVAIRPELLKHSHIRATERGELEVTLGHGRSPWTLRRYEPLVLSGDEARRALGQLLPAVNRLGGKGTEIRDAMARLESAASPDEFIRHVARRGERLTPIRTVYWRQFAGFVGTPEKTGSGLFALPRPVSLALEMATNEERERRAMEGDLALLEAAWRDAEEIAAIADDLLVPTGVQADLDRLKSRS
jgi:hypothetical protein